MRALLLASATAATFAGLRANSCVSQGYFFPAERPALMNGWFVMLGALGAVTATAPAEFVVQAVGWRGLFAVLGALSSVAALLILAVVPECRLPDAPKTRRPISLWFTLSAMAIAVSASGLLLGLAADRLCRFGIRIEHVLATTLSASMIVQAALVFGWPIPSVIASTVIAAAGAATVLSYAALADYFPKEAPGRANAALNILHVGMAFVLQLVTGFIVAQWPAASDRYPAEAHQSAMGLVLLLQVGAVAWFLLAPRRPRTAPSLRRLVEDLRGHAVNDLRPVGRAHVRSQTDAWRAATVASALVYILLIACLMLGTGHASVAAHVIEVMR
jgi:MFS family permease